MFKTLFFYVYLIQGLPHSRLVPQLKESPNLLCSKIIINVNYITIKLKRKTQFKGSKFLNAQGLSCFFFVHCVSC